MNDPKDTKQQQPFDVREFGPVKLVASADKGSTAIISKSGDTSHVEARLTKDGKPVMPSAVGVPEHDVYFDEKCVARAYPVELFKQLCERITAVLKPELQVATNEPDPPLEVA